MRGRTKTNQTEASFVAQSGFKLRILLPRTSIKDVLKHSWFYAELGLEPRAFVHTCTFTDFSIN